MPPKYSLEQKIDAVIATLGPMLEALEIQNDLRTEFLRTLLARFDSFQASHVAELGELRGLVLAIVAELQRLKLAPVLPSVGAPTAEDPDAVLVVRVPAVRITRAAAGKAAGWAWGKVRAPLLAAAIAAWLWFMTKLGLSNAGQ